MVDDTCPNCGHLATADGVEDLLLDTEICPDDMED
jgi:hypothetical protein